MRKYRQQSQLCIITLVMWSATGLTGAQADNAIRLPPEQTARVSAICTDVMGIRKGMVPFDACLESLSQTASNQTQSRLLSKSHDDCLGTGQQDGTAEFAKCVLDREAQHKVDWNSLPTIGMTNRATTVGPGSQPPAKSYWESNADERRRREEYSCAELGIAPGSGGFGLCVAQLDTALRTQGYTD